MSEYNHIQLTISDISWKKFYEYYMNRVWHSWFMLYQITKQLKKRKICLNQIWLNINLVPSEFLLHVYSLIFYHQFIIIYYKLIMIMIMIMISNILYKIWMMYHHVWKNDYMSEKKKIIQNKQLFDNRIVHYRQKWFYVIMATTCKCHGSHLHYYMYLHVCHADISL